MSWSNKVDRQLRARAYQLRKVARRMAELRKVWGLWERLVEAGCLHVPEELQQTAAKLSRVRTKGYADWNPHQEAVLDLLGLVQSTTGRYHYAEVSDLINGFYYYQALRQGRTPDDMQYDVDILKMVVSRQRQRAARKRGRERSGDRSVERPRAFTPEDIRPLRERIIGPDPNPARD